MDREDQQQQQQQDPRKQFEQNLLKQAQGFWNILQGKGGELLLYARLAFLAFHVISLQLSLRTNFVKT